MAMPATRRKRSDRMLRTSSRPLAGECREIAFHAYAFRACNAPRPGAWNAATGSNAAPEAESPLGVRSPRPVRRAAGVETLEVCERLAALGRAYAQVYLQPAAAARAAARL